MATVEIVSSNTALSEETVVLKDKVVKEEIAKPAPPIVSPVDKAKEEESVKVEVVFESSNSDVATPNDKVEVATKEEREEEEEEDDDEVVILTDDDVPDEEENDVPNESSVPKAEAPVAEEAKKEEEKKEVVVEKTG